jgi:hypothetical protein
MPGYQMVTAIKHNKVTYPDTGPVPDAILSDPDLLRQMLESGAIREAESPDLERVSVSDLVNELRGRGENVVLVGSENDVETLKSMLGSGEGELADRGEVVEGPEVPEQTEEEQAEKAAEPQPQKTKTGDAQAVRQARAAEQAKAEEDAKTEEQS